MIFTPETRTANCGFRARVAASKIMTDVALLFCSIGSIVS
jgi:hypothetical protein